MCAFSLVLPWTFSRNVFNARKLLSFTIRVVKIFLRFSVSCSQNRMPRDQETRRPLTSIVKYAVPAEPAINLTQTLMFRVSKNGVDNHQTIGARRVMLQRKTECWQQKQNTSNRGQENRENNKRVKDIKVQTTGIITLMYSLKLSTMATIAAAGDANPLNQGAAIS